MHLCQILMPLPPDGDLVSHNNLGATVDNDSTENIERSAIDESSNQSS